jgi:lysophospholipid acyltransferase (LPLAT)-like uncharacterized protein
MTRLTRIAFACAARAYRAYYATLRVKGVAPNGDWFRPAEYCMDGQIFALCERDTLALGGLMADRRFTVLVALGRDGNWASGLLEALGCRVVRGSTRRGGARALLQVTRSAQATTDPVGIVVDGPLGPAGVAKPGAVLCGLRSGRPVLPLGVASRWKIRFPRTWSGLFLPVPFSSVMVTYLEPPPGEAIEAVEHGTRTLTEQLAVARRRADDALSGRPLASATS